jgi:hypothetical protein
MVLDITGDAGKNALKELVKECGLAPNPIRKIAEKSTAVRCLSPFFHIIKVCYYRL